MGQMVSALTHTSNKSCNMFNDKFFVLDNSVV